MNPNPISLLLPYPPSVNRYWRSVAGRVLISADGRAYRSAVGHSVMTSRAAGRAPGSPLQGRLCVCVTLFPPDRRRRDLDNTLKSLLDSCTHAGLWEDDSQIDDLRVIRATVAAGGIAQVAIIELSALKKAAA